MTILTIQTPFKKSQHYPDLSVCTVQAQYDDLMVYVKKKCEQTRADQNIN